MATKAPCIKASGPQSRFKAQRLYVCHCSSHGCGASKLHVALPGDPNPFGRILRTHAECVRHAADDARHSSTFRIRGSISDEEWELDSIAEVVVDDDNACQDVSTVASSLVQDDILRFGGLHIQDVTPLSVLDSLEKQFAIKRAQDFTGNSLVFRHQPRGDTQESSLHELCYSDTANTSFLHYEQWLRDASKRLNALVLGSRVAGLSLLRQRRTALSSELHSETMRLRLIVLDQWQRESQGKSNTGAQADVDTVKFFQAYNVLRVDAITTLSYLLMATLQLLCHVSNAQCNFVLAVLNSILRSKPASNCSPALIDHLPLDIRTVLSRLGLSPTFRAFVSCPSCFKCYDAASVDLERQVPDFCTHRAHSTEAMCEHPLWQFKVHSGNQTRTAYRRYLQQDFKTWMGRLLCRPGMENYMDAEPFSLTDNSANLREEEKRLYDIWDAEGLRAMKGPDMKPFFHGKRKESEGRYAFSLCMDGFNPLQSKEGGKKYSTCAIYMVCLNLPPSLRYRMENIYLAGVIPGPREPSKEQINHILTPMIDDLLRLYQQGVRYSKTPRYPNGRRVRVILGPLVCDLPAARQMAGFASHSHSYFCSICKLHRHDMECLDERSFKPRRNKEHRKQAEAWRDASTAADRDEQFAINGVRWSELLRLPYWKPIWYTVIDTMHAFFLGLFRRHCRNIWGMDIKIEDGDGSSPDPGESNSQPTERDMRFAFKVVRYGSNNAVNKLSRKVMIRLCEDLQLPRRKRETKQYLVTELLNYRIRQQWFDAAGNPLLSFELQPASATEVEQEISEERMDYAMYLYEYVSFSLNSRGGVAGLNVPTLIALCKHYVPGFHESASCPPTRAELLGVLLKRRQELADTSASQPGADSKPRRTRVLGRTMLPEVWGDMQKTVLPSWIAAGPRELGTARCGKLSADQWRTTCTVHLVVTLGRLWGTKAHEDRFFSMYSNFMDLVTATKLATMRSLTSLRISLFESAIRQYLSGIKTLYKHHTFSPNQHMALHVGPLLRRFGPVHSWRSYPFERWNFVMQKINTNLRAGQLELTLFERFCSMQTLIAYWTDHETSSIIMTDLRSAFRRAFQSDRRGTLQSDLQAMHDPCSAFFEVVYSTSGRRVSKAELRLLRGQLGIEVSDHAVRHNSFQYRGITYKAQQGPPDVHCNGDSHIVIGSDIQECWYPCRIDSIYQIKCANSSKSETKLLVRMFESLTDADSAYDPYKNFVIAGGRIYYSSFHARLRVVSPSEILSHFALTPNVIESIVQPHIHVLPLDRD